MQLPGRYLSLAGAVLALFVSACGEVKGTSNPDGGGSGDAVASGDFGIGIDPGSLDLNITAESTITVNISRGAGFTGAVELSATGLPTGVTATFATTSLPDGTNTTDLTIKVGPTATAGTTDITITGTAGALSHSATLSLKLSTITVTGKVRFSAANVTVRIVGKSAVVSDAMGNFTFTDVIVPYDIYVVGQEGPTNTPIPTVFYYRGLTRPDPVVSSPYTTGLIVVPLSATGTIQGTRSGTGNNTNPVVIKWSTGGEVDNTLDANGGYSFTTSGLNFFNATTPGTLYGLQLTRGTLGAPTGYPGYGSTAGVANKGGTATINLAFSAVTTADITGTISQPAGFPSPTLTLTQQFGSGSAELWSAQTTAAASKIPVIAAGKSAMHAISTSGGRETQVVFPAINANADVTYAMPVPPLQTGPANNATGITSSTPIEFSTIPMTLYEVRIESGSAHYVVYTDSGSITIPTVSELPVPTGTAFTWKVFGWGPYGNINLAADENPLEFVFKADFDGGIHHTVAAPARNFTTQ